MVMLSDSHVRPSWWAWAAVAVAGHEPTGLKHAKLPSRRAGEAGRVVSIGGCFLGVDLMPRGCHYDPDTVYGRTGRWVWEGWMARRSPANRQVLHCRGL